MRIYIDNYDEKEYWTVNNGMNGFWSKFDQLEGDKRDFFFITAISLWVDMRLCSGLNIKLECSSKTSKEKKNG